MRHSELNCVLSLAMMPVLRSSLAAQGGNASLFINSNLSIYTALLSEKFV